MNLLVVEDEIRLRNSIVNHIPWEENGIQVVGQAANGVEALALIDRKKPDIILMDLQMPEMDGMTLITRLRENQHFMKIIILSGHDNFTYAQKAMEYGVSKYLLKPAGDAEILQSVLDAADELRVDLDRWHKETQLNERWSHHLPYLQNDFLQNWVYGKFDAWEVRNKSKDLLIEAGDHLQYAVAVVDVDPSQDAKSPFGPNDVPLQQFSITSIAKELFPASFCYIVTGYNGSTLLLFHYSIEEVPNEVMLRVNTEVVKLLSHVKLCLKFTASAGISGQTGSLEDVRKLFIQAEKALKERIVYGNDVAIPYMEKLEKERELLIQPNFEKVMEIALQTEEETKALEALTDFWEDGIGKAESGDEIHENVLYLSSLFIRMIQKQGWSVKDVVGEDYEYFQNVKLLNSKEHIWNWMKRTIANFTAFSKRKRKTISHGTVKSILAIVEKEIDQEITLHTIADRLFVNSSYLSKLFKQETGKAFSAYVIERKMERAKVALAEGAKVYDAATAVGYRDVSYFTKVFRKYWGVTPGEVKG